MQLKRQEWPKGERPPSHFTYTREHITQTTPKDFLKAIVEVHWSIMPPTIKWIFHQIVLRTIWMKDKQSQHEKNGDDRCSNCNIHPERRDIYSITATPLHSFEIN